MVIVIVIGYCYHHCRAFELISRALKIDEEQGNKDGATVELYKKGTPLMTKPQLWRT